MSARRARTWLVALTAAVGATAALAGIAALAQVGCTQPPFLEPLRSLERSGAVSFICLAIPNAPGGIVRPLSDCTGFATVDPATFSLDDAGTELTPHLYAMVTQTSRGEVAVVDLTAQELSVLDEDPGVPGANFLPIGAQPVSIVSTPGSTATFVAVGEIGREGIYALPSTLVRPSDLLEDAGVNPETPRAVPQLSSWPACSLPAAPGKMILVSDPDVGGTERARCDKPYGKPTAGANGDLSLEHAGRQKLLITVPDLGGIAIVDAQTLLDAPPGSFDACPVDRWLPLHVELPKTQNPPPRPAGPACVWPVEKGPDYASKYAPRPSGIAYDAASHRLYVGDFEAPVVHRVDLPTPCEPVERDPLLPRATQTDVAGDPTRVVVTSQLSLGQLTTDLAHQYLYAVDEKDASMMVFDVGPASTSPYPIERPHPEWDPLAPRDRVRLPSPVADVLVATHDAAQPLPTTGVAPEGTLCDPNPALSCDPTTTTCDVGALYRTSPAFDFGAGPLKLRGQFAYAALTNGTLGVVDVEDFDAPCRIPGGTPPDALVPLAGCPPVQPLPSKPPDNAALASSDEVSCNVVLPNTPRDELYTAPDQNAGFHVPGVQTLPVLYDFEGTVIETPNAPFMEATVPVDSPLPLNALAIGGLPVAVCSGDTNTSCLSTPTGQYLGDDGKPQNTLYLNLEDPRAHVADQTWTVTFEGAIPGFAGQLGTLQVEGKPSDGLYTPSSRFCDAGVQSEKAVEELFAAYGVHDASIKAKNYADYVQIFTDLPLETDPFWVAADPKECSFTTCNTAFGTLETPAPGRDLRVVEAYQDHLELVNRTDDKPIDIKFVDCCFPPPIAFNVRVGRQWLVAGQVSGFLHHVIPDPTTGVCRNSCDPDLVRMNGRVIPVPNDAAAIMKYTPVPDPDFVNGKVSPFAFINPMFRFAVVGGNQRDENFQFATQGSFLPLLVTLAPDATTLMTPVAVAFVPPLGEVMVVDGGHQGLTVVNLDAAAVARQFF
ncbi:MAG TPA: hypothetical protein VHB21_22270 [Minicystis sp.]|nr:hypothetical protein [Minicystis sp.]